MNVLPSRLLEVLRVALGNWLSHRCRVWAFLDVLASAVTSGRQGAFTLTFRFLRAIIFAISFSSVFVYIRPPLYLSSQAFFHIRDLAESPSANRICPCSACLEATTSSDFCDKGIQKPDRIPYRTCTAGTCFLGGIISASLPRLEHLLSLCIPRTMTDNLDLACIESSLESTVSTISTNTSSPKSQASQGVMLSVDFSTPLVGAARAERIKQMTSGHVS